MSSRINLDELPSRLQLVDADPVGVLVDADWGLLVVSGSSGTSLVVVVLVCAGRGGNVVCLWCGDYDEKYIRCLKEEAELFM